MSFRFNNALSQIVALAVLALLTINSAAPARACGPFFVEPVFVSASSPDLPFSEFTIGKIGIIKPSFGRKTLTIAFRYLNGGSFTSDEQKVLVAALRARASEESGTDPVKTWIATRKEFLTENEKLPEIYVEQRYEKFYESLLPWDTQSNFDDATVDVLNFHFPLSQLAEISRNPALPQHLRRRMALTAWTRAVVLKQPAIAEKLAPDVLKFEPNMASVMQPYLDARTPKERNDAALFVLLKFPNLSPLLRTGVPDFKTVEAEEYYLQDAWWCAPSNTEYNLKGDEVPKTVPKPVFLTAAQIDSARRERASLVAIDDAKSYLGKQTLAWAKRSPQDPCVPEALNIAVQANSRYKYGCSGWDHDQQAMKQADHILRTKYPQSPWTAKLGEPGNQESQ